MPPNRRVKATTPSANKIPLKVAVLPPLRRTQKAPVTVIANQANPVVKPIAMVKKHRLPARVTVIANQTNNAVKPIVMVKKHHLPAPASVIVMPLAINHRKTAAANHLLVVVAVRILLKPVRRMVKHGHVLPQIIKNGKNATQHRLSLLSRVILKLAPVQIKRAADLPKGRMSRYNGRKKLALRAPSHKEQLRIERLKDLRVKPEDLPAMRLQKAMALAGLGSRRAMEELIQAGRVTINHRPAQLGDRVSPDDKVRLDGKPVFIRWPDRLPRIVIYHKQEGELVTRDDPEGRVTVFDRLPQAHSSRWVAVGRLDLNTSGLLVMTTSGELANRMMHPSFEVEREYAVRVLGELTDELKKSLLAGIELEDGTAKFDRLIDQGGEGANHWYRVIIREGRNREVRRLFEAVGLTVSRLIRVRFGALTLPPRLKRGQFYELNASEAAQVMKWAGLDVNGLARE